MNMKIQDLRNENWISAREIKTVGKGRSPMVYSLAMPIGDIIKRLEDEKLREHAEAMENIQKLKGLMRA